MSSLGDGQRVDKDDIIFDALGHIDEANAAIGVARSFVDKEEVIEILINVQNQMFDVGSDICTPGNKDIEINLGYIEYLENEIDKLLETQVPLTSFIIPAGGSAASHLHLARTVVRRAERAVWTAVNYYPKTNVLTAQYLNRLSDLLFVLARECSVDGDVLWKPGIQY